MVNSGRMRRAAKVGDERMEGRSTETRVELPDEELGCDRNEGVAVESRAVRSGGGTRSDCHKRGVAQGARQVVKRDDSEMSSSRTGRRAAKQRASVGVCSKRVTLDQRGENYITLRLCAGTARAAAKGEEEEVVVTEKWWRRGSGERREASSSSSNSTPTAEQ